ncbi:hypothetical protein KIN20_011774 [Parelaphostrongylus tenuis]|uniref:Uncharacterized protein n=1 Tax=Parelaphostrongylus tenuis TaxID=148309 RepID=A0AAD5MBC2_PARTN|nr:hypothetical protein KIN20_011774 [Parelaphostrongylus tenuis]
MTDILSSPTIKSGNVLALLDALYTSGFAMASPTVPLLKGPGHLISTKELACSITSSDSCGGFHAHLAAIAGISISSIDFVTDWRKIPAPGRAEQALCDEKTTD